VPAWATTSDRPDSDGGDGVHEVKMGAESAWAPPSAWLA
jgi:hypothetical protein